MSSENPFKVLKISPNSDINKIKQAFRSLVLSTHPDVNHDSNSHADTEKLISAYHKALSEAQKKAQSKKNTFDISLFELQYELFFGKDFQYPKTKRDFFRHLTRLLQNVRNFFYNKSDFAFLHSYLTILIKRLNTKESPTWSGYLRAIFESFDCLLNFRSKTLTLGNDEEYKQEKLRMETIRYFQDIAANSKNYLNLRRSLMLSRDYLITGCVQAINESAILDYQQEFFTVMSIIALLGEEDLLSEWEL